MSYPRSDVWNHFSPTDDGRVMCIYCSGAKMQPNATKSRRHLAFKCLRASKKVRDKYRESFGHVVVSSIQNFGQASSHQSNSESMNDEEGENHGIHSRKSSHQADSLNQFAIKMNAHQLEYARMCFSKAIFTGNVSYRWMDNIWLAKLFSFLGITKVKPDRKILASTILTKVSDEIKLKNAQEIEKSKTITVVIDGWSNVRVLPVVNIILCTPKPIFYKSLEFGGQSEDTAFFHKLLKDIIEEIGVNKVVAVVTDNAGELRSAKNLLHANYKTVIPIGCGAHWGNRFAEDIIRLPTINIIITKVQSVVGFFKHSKLRMGKVIDMWNQLIQEDETTVRINLSMPAPTRWFGVIEMLEHFIRSERVLRRLAANDIFKKSRLSSSQWNHGWMSDFVSKEDTWIKCQQVKDFLEPIMKMIGELESDDSRLSDMTAAFIRMRKTYMSFDSIKQTLVGANTSSYLVEKCLPEMVPAIRLDMLNEKEKKKLNERIEFRFNKDFMKGAHFAAYYLDPRYNLPFGDPHFFASLSASQRKMGRKFVTNYCRHLGFFKNDQDFVAINKLMLHFEHRSDIFEDELEYDDTMCPADQWRQMLGILREEPLGLELATVAIKLLSIPSSNASSERSFSTQKRIHTKDRTNLLASNVDKLMRINWDYRDMVHQERQMLKKKMMNDHSQDDEDIESELMIEEMNFGREFNEEELDLIEQFDNEMDCSCALAEFDQEIE